VERTRRLNPEVDPAALVEGQEIWRVQRSTLPAGFYRSWDHFAEEYLGNKYAWPALWGANPAINRPTLQPTDIITVPAKLLTPPIASARPTVADVAAKLRAGTAIVGVDTAANVARLYVDDPKRAKAIGDWLATQKFDPHPQSKTAKALTKLFGGKASDFEKGRKGTFIQFLSVGYPTVTDPIFPDDPRYPTHIIQRP
jgi:hypothetical protein